MSGHTHQKLLNGVVTSDAIQGAKKWTRKWLLIIPSILILAVGTFLLYQYYHQASPVTANITSRATNRGTTAQQQANAALAAAKGEVGSAKTSMQKAEAYKNLGMAYFNTGDYPDAIAAYNNAIETDSAIKPEVLDTLAYVYATNGQRDKAIAMYQELIADTQKQSNDGHEAMNYEGGPIQAYQHDIQVLQQGGTL